MIFTIVFICVALVQLYSNEFSYVGADKCKICHKTEKQGAQYTIWESTKHSKSYQALTLDETKAKVPDAPENPDCLKCHGPLHSQPLEGQTKPAQAPFHTLRPLLRLLRDVHV